MEMEADQIGIGLDGELNDAGIDWVISFYDRIPTEIDREDFFREQTKDFSANVVQKLREALDVSDAMFVLG